MVSLKDTEKQVRLSNLTIHKFKKLVKQSQNKANKLVCYIGFWVEDSTLYFDCSIKVDDKQIALFLGKKNEQKAIFDIAKQDSIYLA